MKDGRKGKMEGEEPGKQSEEERSTMYHKTLLKEISPLFH